MLVRFHIQSVGMDTPPADQKKKRGGIPVVKTSEDRKLNPGGREVIIIRISCVPRG